MRIVGMDPGKGGCLYLIVDRVPIDFWDTPLDSKGKLLNPQQVVTILEGWNPDTVVIEKVSASPRQGSSAAFNFGCNFYGLICICAGLGLSYHTITPQKWKAYHGLLKKDKDAARLLALKKFPQLDEVLKRKGDVDRADAILMATAWEAMNR